MAVLFPDAIPRPTKDKPAIRDKAIDELCRDVTKWWRSKYQDSSEVLEIRADLCKVLDESRWRDDGYEICRDLERDCGWAPDAELVDIADIWGSIINKHYRDAVKAWVKECNIEPQFKVGDRVRATWSRQEIEGVICRIDRDDARVTIQRSGDGPGCGAVVDYEKVLGVVNA